MVTSGKRVLMMGVGALDAVGEEDYVEMGRNAIFNAYFCVLVQHNDTGCFS